MGYSNTTHIIEQLIALNRFPYELTVVRDNPKNGDGLKRRRPSNLLLSVEPLLAGTSSMIKAHQTIVSSVLVINVCHLFFLYLVKYFRICPPLMDNCKSDKWYCSCGWWNIEGFVELSHSNKYFTCSSYPNCLICFYLFIF